MSLPVSLSGIVALLICYVIGFSVRECLNGFKIYVAINRSSRFSNETKVGDYIHFSGRLTTPTCQGPIDKRPCGYWAMVIKGVFTRRRKKPSSGSQTFKPTALMTSSEDFPFLVSNGHRSIQYVFKHNHGLAINPEKRTEKTATIPWFEGQENVDPSVWKTKYTRYESTILSIPVKAKLACWGQVKAILNNSCILGESDIENQITRVYLGEQAEFVGKLRALIVIQLLVAVVLALLLFSLWFWGTGFYTPVQHVAVSAIVAAFGYVLGRLSKKAILVGV